MLDVRQGSTSAMAMKNQFRTGKALKTPWVQTDDKLSLQTTNKSYCKRLYSSILIFLAGTVDTTRRDRKVRLLGNIWGWNVDTLLQKWWHWGTTVMRSLKWLLVKPIYDDGKPNSDPTPTLKNLRNRSRTVDGATQVGQDTPVME